MKCFRCILGTLFALSLIIIMLISSVEIAAYSDYGWYEKEYEKYHVLEKLQMEMPDVMNVTKEMMKYLRGDRENLVVQTIVDGEEQEFFNEKEKLHMIDVRNLFHGGQWIRRIAVLVVITSVLILLLTKQKIITILLKSFLCTCGGLIVIFLGLGLGIMADFTKAFTLFHEILFSNDLWLLNFRTDLLIRMLPEGVFVDMLVRIVLIFGAFIFGTSIICIILLLKQKKIRKTN